MIKDTEIYFGNHRFMQWPAFYAKKVTIHNDISEKRNGPNKKIIVLYHDLRTT